MSLETWRSGEEFKYGSANKKSDARSDVRIRGFWGNKKDAFFEFRVFYPFASSIANKSVETSFSHMSKARKREYEERINHVDNGSFTPMILASTGGTGTEMMWRSKFSRKNWLRRTTKFTLMSWETSELVLPSQSPEAL